MEARETEAVDFYYEGVRDGYKKGIREVVEWIKTHKKVTETDLYIGRATYKHYDIQEGALEAKLKEWGIA